MKPYEIEAPTAQQILDLTAEHLAGMKKRAMRGLSSCAYRNHLGCRCAVGAWLRDEEIHIPLEAVRKLRALGVEFTTSADIALTLDDLSRSAVSAIDRDGLLPRRLQPHLSLLLDLQQAHDRAVNWSSGHSGPETPMAVAFASIARHHGLDPRHASAALTKAPHAVA